MKITLEQYAGPYLEHVDFSWERREAAEQLLAAVNELRALAATDGVELRLNPRTGSGVSGGGNGGFRPQSCPIGAKHSRHKLALAVDNYDPERRLAAWCYLHPEVLRARNIVLENARWTPTWCHMQLGAPGVAGAPWRLDFIPSTDPPLAASLPEQIHGTSTA
jgi:hypothetical protein